MHYHNDKMYSLISLLRYININKADNTKIILKIKNSINPSLFTNFLVGIVIVLSHTCTTN
ncbi:hypothetical protein rpr22_0411 [Rickettsia prowazekii str. Rp22]|uniref:Uncharacterized protein n=1 Tax=Rickettsia prowazekii (strain Rp22) TaxID=449216 RepID=D5AWX5_RICPP|nr:hypothetical protein rpr22_0411 [Rickettsia prowazekii str. Rp22]